MLFKRMGTAKENTIYLNKDLCLKLKLLNQKLTLQLGTFQKEVTVDVVDEITENEIGISTTFLESITLPEDIDFDWYIKDDKLVMGPFIGIIRYYHINKITQRSLRFLERWLIDYKNINGLIYVIPLSEIEKGKSTVNGFYYNPNKKKKWIYGTFPYPNVAFNRPFLKMGRKYHMLVKKIGNTCFNKKEPGKWEFYSWMLQNQLTEKLVPYTENLTQFSQVTQMVEKYEMVYLKRSYGGLGNGILQVKKIECGYEVQNIKGDIKVFKKKNDLENYISTIINKQKYIVQQGIPFKVNERKVDFRIYLQKDGNMEWRVGGIVARVARRGKIITNIRYTEQILSAKDALLTEFEYDEHLTNETISIMEKAALLAGTSIDQYGGHYGDLALDMIYDGETKQIFFLEANSGYAHKSLTKINDPSLRESILRRPLEYAKALAGF